jgi:hypothetical protein
MNFHNISSMRSILSVSKGFELFQKDWMKNPRLIQTINIAELERKYGLTSAEVLEILKAKKECTGLAGKALEARTTKGIGILFSGGGFI